MTHQTSSPLSRSGGIPTNNFALALPATNAANIIEPYNHGAFWLADDKSVAEHHVGDDHVSVANRPATNPLRKFTGKFLRDAADIIQPYNHTENHIIQPYNHTENDLVDDYFSAARNGKKVVGSADPRMSPGDRSGEKAMPSGFNADPLGSFQSHGPAFAWSNNSGAPLVAPPGFNADHFYNSGLGLQHKLQHKHPGEQAVIAAGVLQLQHHSGNVTLSGRDFKELALIANHFLDEEQKKKPLWERAAQAVGATSDSGVKKALKKYNDRSFISRMLREKQNRDELEMEVLTANKTSGAERIVYALMTGKMPKGEISKQDRWMMLELADKLCKEKTISKATRNHIHKCLGSKHYYQQVGAN